MNKKSEMFQSIKNSLIGKNTNPYERDEWVKDQSRQLPKGSKILDAGAGECKYKKYCGHLKYTSQDFCQYDPQKSEKGLHDSKERWDYHQIDVVCDICDLPFEADSFDAILCTEVFEHIPSPEAALHELVRVLKRGGMLILTAPFISLTHFYPYHYYSGFNVPWWQAVLKDNQCELVSCTPHGDFFQYLRYMVITAPNVYKTYYGKSSRILWLKSIIFASWIKKYQGNNKSHELCCYGYMITAKKEK